MGNQTVTMFDLKALKVLKQSRWAGLDGIMAAARCARAGDCRVVHRDQGNERVLTAFCAARERNWP